MALYPYLYRRVNARSDAVATVGMQYQPAPFRRFMEALVQGAHGIARKIELGHSSPQL